MSELPIQHATASKWAAIMLGATALAAALTLGVFVLPRPTVRPPDLKADPSVGAAKTPRRLPWEGIATDWSRVASDLERANAPDIAAWKKDVEEQRAKAAREAQASGPGGPAASPPDGGGFAPNWRFLGAVIDGDRRTALVVIPEADGAQRQRFVAEGFVKDEYRLVGIEPSKLIIEQGRKRHELKLAANQRGQAITSGSATPPTRSVAPVGSPIPGQTNRFGGPERARDLRQPGRAATANAPTAPGAGVPVAPPTPGVPTPFPPPQPGTSDQAADPRQPVEPESGIR